MPVLPMLLFFISISSEPIDPGPNKYGSEVMWVLSGAPSSAEARNWAEKRFKEITPPSSVPQKITAFLVLPLKKDTLYTDKGSEPVPWASSPDWNTNSSKNPSGVDPEMVSMVCITAPNRFSGKAADRETPTHAQLRAALEKQNKSPVEFNWDENRLRYFIFYTSKQATLVRSINSIAAAIPYAKQVRGTPTGDENAAITLWPGMTKYQDSPP